MKKYNNLLLAVDIYENDDDLIEEGLSLARTYGGKFNLVHVIPAVISSVPFAYDFQDAIKSHARERVAEIKAKFNLADDQVFIRQGRAQNEIVALAKEENIDLILCGSHGKHGLGLMLGSTAAGILHEAKVDVLTIRINRTGERLAKFPYKNIVLAVDLSADNKAVRECAVALAATFGAKLHLIHVVADIAIMGYYAAVDFDFNGEARKMLQALIVEESIPVNPADVHIETGFPKEEILHLAKTVEADLIVMGSHGRKAIISAVVGSTANAILHKATTDIMVVRI